MVQVPPRSEIAPEHTWNAPSVYPNSEAWAAELKNLLETIPQLAKSFRGRLGESAAVLADWFEQSSNIRLRTDKAFVYAAMSQSVDTSDQAAAGMLSQAYGLYANFTAELAFAEPEILAVGKEKITAWLAAEPRLRVYNQYFDNLFRLQAHVRSAEVEEVLGVLSDAFAGVGNTADVLRNADMKFSPAMSGKGEQLPVTQGTMNTLLASTDREARRTAWENYADAHLALKHTLASNLMVNIKRQVAIARIRGYKSALESTLAPNNIPAEVFHNLIATFKRHIPTWHRYWAIRRRALGVEKLYHWDIWAPLATKKVNIPYQQAVDWISEGMKPLGEEYVRVLRRGCLEERWVDIFPNQNKQQGAFSSGAQGTFPFILMSYDNEITNMSTLAHELGHSLHSYLTWQNQPNIYSYYSLFAAEVASNFNQAMVRDYLFRTNSDRDFQLALIEEAMSNFHRYFFIMPTLARFELELHERAERGQPVAADDMISLMADLFSEGYGPEMDVHREREGITWAEFSHLYANFYVYAYATGISGAHALANRILKGTPGAVDDYLGFLKAGGSLYPLDALKRAGVDLTTPEPVETTFGVLSQIVDRLEKLIQ